MIPHPEFAFHHLLRNAVDRDPGKVAIVDGKAEYTYEDLARSSSALSAALLDAGVAKGDRVGIFMEKSWEAVVAMLAASQAGAAFVNINPLLKPPQVRYITEDCDIKVLVGDRAKLEGLEPGLVETAFYKGDEPPDTDAADSLMSLNKILGPGDGSWLEQPVLEGDLGTILYTSGSTGQPKGVAFSQRNLVVGAQIVSTYVENTAEDRILAALPFSFDYGLNQLTSSLRVGATLILQNSRLPGDLIKGLRRHEATGLAGVPPLWTLLLRSAKSLEEQPLEHLRYITNSGGRIPYANLQELRRLLTHTKIYLMYGLTEAFRSTYLPPDELDRVTPENWCIGKAIPNAEVYVVNKDGEECAPGETGELVHRGPTVAMGYWGKVEATRKAYKTDPFAHPELPESKVVHSGDLAYRDEEGYLYLVGRADAMIKSQGYRMSPEEIEDLIIGSGYVSEAVAFGVPDPDVGAQVIVAVSLKDGVNGDRNEAAEKIREHCVKNGPPYMVPKEIVVQDELPKTGSGKVDRKTVSNAYTAG
ncbi:MAG TPA: AMP-binding protein [Rubrobacteraceae bacterium]|nr:AMP-binding protein [Rubrobacteraceae bacterium]